LILNYHLRFTFVKTSHLNKPFTGVDSFLKTIATAFTFSFFATSCMQLDSFEQNVEITKHEWSAASPAEVSFNITDTISTYNVFVVLRHTDAYAYKNIWLNIATQQPGDKQFKSDRFELILQQPDGTWIGTGLNDIWEIRYPLFTNVRFVKQGTYRIRLQQAMRDEPLLHILNAGMRIEKVNR
jgi:gliding motility-associated lipoprotein GldH